MNQIKCFISSNFNRLPIFIALSFLCASCASPESDFRVNVTGETIIEYIGKDIEVIIPSKIYGEKITAIGSSAFLANKTVLSVTIPSGVQSIGGVAFCGSIIRKIKIPNSVTIIEKNAFASCNGLKEITLPNSLTTIGDGAFSPCDNLKNIKIPKSVISLGNAPFESCSNLDFIEVETENSNYCSIDGVLFNKNSTTILKYPSKKAGIMYVIPSSVKNIARSAFRNCKNLTSFEIPINVTSIGEYAFEGSTSLVSIKIPANITTIGEWAFEGCNSLKTVRVEAINPPKIDNHILGSLWSHDYDNIDILVPKESIKVYTKNWGYMSDKSNNGKFNYIGY
jgi:hypothetical protein